LTGVWEVVNIQELKQAGLNKKTVSEMLSLVLTIIRQASLKMAAEQGIL
jgi:hypothetical protein